MSVDLYDSLDPEKKLIYDNVYNEKMRECGNEIHQDHGMSPHAFSSLAAWDIVLKDGNKNMTEKKLSFDPNISSSFNVNMMHKQFAVCYQDTEYVCDTWHFCMPTSDYIGGTSWGDYATKDHLSGTNILELDIAIDPGRKFVSRFFKGDWVVGDNPNDELLRLIVDRSKL